MSNIVSPYVNTEFHSRISLFPHQMNNEIYIHLKNNLKKKIEKKCNKYGYVTKLFKILDYSDGEIIPENFDSSSIFNIKYSCRVCLPIEQTEIICKVDFLNKALIKAVNGPIIGIIKMTELNTDKFSLNNKGDIVYSTNNKILEVGSHIIIKVLGLNFFAGDERIIILASLEDIPTETQIKQYFEENLLTEDLEEVNNSSEINKTENYSESDSDNETESIGL